MEIYKATEGRAQVKIKFIDDLAHRSFEVPCTLEGGEAKYFGSQAGETHAGMHIACPGCKKIIGISFVPGSGPQWHWDGNIENPSVSPSIEHLDCWHGHLHKGEFKPC